MCFQYVFTSQALINSLACVLTQISKLFSTWWFVANMLSLLASVVGMGVQEDIGSGILREQICAESCVETCVGNRVDACVENCAGDQTGA